MIRYNPQHSAASRKGDLASQSLTGSRKQTKAVSTQQRRPDISEDLHQTVPNHIPGSNLLTRYLKWRNHGLLRRSPSDGKFNSDDDEITSLRSTGLLRAPNGQVYGGTLSELVKWLITQRQLDEGFAEALLMGSSPFATPNAMFQLLAQESKVTLLGSPTHDLELGVEIDPNRTRTRVAGLLCKMIELGLVSNEDNKLLEAIKLFTAENLSNVSSAKTLTTLLDYIQTHGSLLTPQHNATHNQAFPAPALFNPHRANRITQIDPLELARQLTLMESRLYDAIDPNTRLLHANGSIPDSIRTIIVTANKISTWVATLVLCGSNARGRGWVIKYFIQVLEACQSLQNYSTMAAIVAGLRLPAIQRLGGTWNTVPHQYVTLLCEIERIFAWEKGFAAYREKLKTSVPSCVPFLGVHLAELGSIEDRWGDFISQEDGIINFYKIRKIVNVTQEIRSYQGKPYNLAPVTQIQAFIGRSLVDIEENADLWEASVLAERTVPEDKMITRILQETGFLQVEL